MKNKYVTSIRNLFLFIASLVSLQVSADDAQIRKEINSIIKSNQYIYGEHTAATEKEAREIAEEILEANIKEWVATKKRFKESANIVINNKKSLSTSLTVSRGNLVRVFLYVKKSDIIAGNNAEIVKQPQNEVKSEVELLEEKVINKIEYPEVVTTIASYQDYKPMAEKIEQFKEQGKILHYGRYTSLENPESYYLAIYNTAGKVVAVLTPGEIRHNVATGETDRVTNYSGCGAIGFIPSK
jgi:hypothetical protein